MENQPTAIPSVSSLAIQHLSDTKPWVRFISILTFICAGLMLLAAVGMILVGVIGGAAAGFDKAGAPAGMFMIFMALIYAVCSLIYIYPALKLWKYANGIERLISTGSEQDLVDALDQQRSFWKFVGVLMIIMLGLYAIVIVFAIIGGMVGGAMAS